MTDPGAAQAAPDKPRTPWRWKLAAIAVVVVALAPASWLARRGLAKLEFFHVRSVSIEGTRYLSPDSIMKRLAVDTTQSVWDDTRLFAAKVRGMPQVTDVEISRRLPGTLVVRVHENLPVAFVPSPRGLEAVDTAGTVLPIDPSAEDIDLPVAHQRDVPILRFLGRVRAEDARLYHRISDVSRDGRSGLVLTLLPKALRVRVPAGVPVSRLADIFPVESDLARRRARVAELDLHYRDQVIARLQ